MKRFRKSIFKLLQPLPKTPAPVPSVYVLLDKADEPLYIGQSMDTAKRVSQHRAAKRPFDKVLCFTPDNPTRSELLRFEGILILTLLPTGNSVLALRVTQEGVYELPYSFVGKSR
jgi:hypothetical protein